MSSRFGSPTLRVAGLAIALAIGSATRAAGQATDPAVAPPPSFAELMAPVDPSPPAPPPPGRLTGDWFGARTGLEEGGITFRAQGTQFYQGVTAGGLRQRFGYGLKLDYFAKIDGEKLLGRKGLFVNFHGESRFGDSINADDGDFVPANFALQFPKGRGAATALTDLTIQQFLSPNLVLTAGKINTADGMNVHPFMGGYGTDRFMNTAYVISNLVLGRALPYSTPGAGFIYLKDLDPVFTFLVVDPFGRPDTSGIKRLFNNGASLYSQIRLPVKPAGLRGHQTLEAVYSSGKFQPLAGDDYVIVPARGLVANRQTGTWAFNYGFDQYLVTDPNDPSRGWGVFGNFGLADEDTNPIRYLINAGLAGTSPLPCRPADSFGLAYYYLGTSDPLQDALDRIFPIRNEQGFEFYYNAAITPWFTLALDLQAMDPARFDARSALLVGLRAKIVF